MSDPRLRFATGIANGSADGAILEELDRVRPLIGVAPGLDPIASTAVGMLFSMLTRLFPHTEIEGDAPMGPNPWSVAHLSELPARLASARPSPTRAPDRDIVIGVGEYAGGTLWMGGGDWTAEVGRSPQPISAGRFGIGLHAAAVLVAAEISKLVLGPLGMRHVSFGDSLTWNLWDYRLQPAPATPVSALQPLRVVWFGTGSVGTSSIGVTTSVAGLVGKADIVDADSFDPSRNPFRYPAIVGDEVGAKVEWAKRALRGAGWDASGSQVNVASWVRAQNEPGLPGIAVSSVDRVDGRLQVADALIGTYLSVGVDGMALHIQREQTYDEFACPYCDFVSVDPPMSRIDLVAAQVKLPPARVAKLLLEGEPLSPEDIAMATQAGAIAPDGADELIGRRIDDLIRRAYADVAIPQEQDVPPATVTAPYVSQMGGVLITAELLKAALGVEGINRRYDLDLSGVPMEGVARRPRDASGNCICASPHRHRWAARMYGGQWNPTTTQSGQESSQEPQTGRPSITPTGG
jgi:hypothetical protein